METLGDIMDRIDQEASDALDKRLDLLLVRKELRAQADMTMYQLLLEADSLLVEVRNGWYYEPIYAQRKLKQLEEIIAEMPKGIEKFTYNSSRKRD